MCSSRLVRLLPAARPSVRVGRAGTTGICQRDGRGRTTGFPWACCWNYCGGGGGPGSESVPCPSPNCWAVTSALLLPPDTGSIPLCPKRLSVRSEAHVGKTRNACSDLCSPSAVHERASVGMPPGAIAGMAKAALPDSKTPWWQFVEDCDRIRDTMATVLEGFEDFNRRARHPNGFASAGRLASACSPRRRPAYGYRGVWV
jgi:hypothetical protein